MDHLKASDTDYLEASDTAVSITARQEPDYEVISAERLGSFTIKDAVRMPDKTIVAVMDSISNGTHDVFVFQVDGDGNALEAHQAVIKHARAPQSYERADGTDDRSRTHLYSTNLVNVGEADWALDLGQIAGGIKIHNVWCFEGEGLPIEEIPGVNHHRHMPFDPVVTERMTLEDIQHLEGLVQNGQVDVKQLNSAFIYRGGMQLGTGEVISLFTDASNEGEILRFLTTEEGAHQDISKTSSSHPGEDWRLEIDGLGTVMIDDDYRMTLFDYEGNRVTEVTDFTLYEAAVDPVLDGIAKEIASDVNANTVPLCKP